MCVCVSLFQKWTNHDFENLVSKLNVAKTFRYRLVTLGGSWFWRKDLVLFQLSTWFFKLPNLWLWYFSQEFQTHSYSERVKVPLLLLSHLASRSKIVQYQFCASNKLFFLMIEKYSYLFIIDCTKYQNLCKEQLQHWSCLDSSRSLGAHSRPIMRLKAHFNSSFDSDMNQIESRHRMGNSSTLVLTSCIKYYVPITP